MNRKSRFVVRVALLMFAGLLCSAPGTVAGPRSRYRAAKARWDRMQKHPDRYRDRDWRALASAFRMVYYRYPTSPYADDGVFFEAEIFRYLYERTNRIEDWERAVRKYKFLIAEYPTSSHGIPALLQIARLYRQRGIAEWTSYVDQCPKLFGRRRCEREPLYAPLVRAVQEARRRKMRRTAVGWPSIRAQLADIQPHTSATYTRVTIYLTNSISYRPGILKKPDRLYIDLDATTLSEEVKHRNWTFPPRAHLRRIRVGQYLPDTARVVLDFDRIKAHRIFHLENPFRIVIDIFQEDWQPAGRRAVPATRAPGTPPAVSRATVPKPNRSGRYSLYRQLNLKIRRIMIDPGHGGEDPGAIGVNGMKEKDVVLAVAKALKREIERRWDVEVLLTREDDRFLPLEERTALANSLQADLFISIHANASRDARAHGIETYYLHWARDRRSMEVAARENAIAQASMHELKELLGKFIQNRVEESRDLATFIQKGLVEAVQAVSPTRDLGVKPAPFYVLMGAEMPAVLVELSFLTHPQEGKRLADHAYQQRLVTGLMEGLEQYLASTGSLAMLAK